MGMTDSQFKAFVRFLIDALKDAREETGESKEKKMADGVSQVISIMDTLFI